MKIKAKMMILLIVTIMMILFLNSISEDAETNVGPKI